MMKKSCVVLLTYSGQSEVSSDWAIIFSNIFLASDWSIIFSNAFMASDWSVMTSLRNVSQHVYASHLFLITRGHSIFST